MSSELPLGEDQPNVFKYIPEDKYKKDVSSKPRLYEGRHNRVAPITPIMSSVFQSQQNQEQSERVTPPFSQRQKQQQQQQQQQQRSIHITQHKSNRVTSSTITPSPTKTAQHALNSHKNDTLLLKEKEE